MQRIKATVLWGLVVISRFEQPSRDMSKLRDKSIRVLLLGAFILKITVHLGFRFCSLLYELTHT